MPEMTYRHYTWSVPLGLWESNRLTFFKTIFARINNVKAGKFVDDETGESLNDVEKVLGELGIALRDTNGEFRSSSAVLDEVGRKWSTYNSVQQHAIATAIAGTRQQEKLLVLFENYGDAINYANTATTSSNTAMEKYSAYTESIEGKLNTLTASFEAFSTTVLDTGLVTFFLDVANGALTGLNAVAGFGDGVITTLGAVTVTTAVTTALIQTIIAKFGAKLESIFTALGTAMLNAFKNPLTYITILVSMFIAFQDKINGTWKIVIAAVAGISAALLTILVVSKIVANGISTAIMNIPIFGWIVAILQLVITTIMAISGAINELKNDNKLREQALETAEAFQEQADAIREVSEAAKEATDSIHSLVEEFENAQEETPSNPAEWLASVKEIGEEASALFGDEQLTALQAINRLTNDELTYNDLINMSLGQRIKLLKAIEEGSYDIAQQTAADAYAAQKQASDQLTYALTAYGYDLENDNDTWTWGNLKNNQIDAAIDEAEEIAGRINGLSMSSNAGHDIDIKVDAGTLTDYVNTLRAAVDEYEERYKYNFGALSENAVYKYLSDSLSQAEASLNQQQETVYSLLDASAKALGSDLEIHFDANGTKEAAKDAYNKAVEELVTELQSDDTIKQAIADGLFGDDDEVAKILNEHAQEYMRSYHTELYNAANNLPTIVTRKIAIDIFDELDGEYSLLSDALEEFSESGMVSAKTIRAMTDEFPDLLKYIRQTEDGFTMLDTTLDSIMASYWADKAKDFEEPIKAAYEYYNALVNAYDGSVEQYIAINDAYKTLKTAVANGIDFITAYNVTVDDLLEEQYTELLEKQKDIIDEQVDAFGELCDIRKELLKTYEDEVNYQRELEKKQRTVTGLQTKLSVARLDQSAAGQARVRELEAELKEAQDELEEFTLEHAIDVLTKQIESTNAEFEAMMENAIVRLENAIAGAASMTATALKNAITSLGETPVSSGGNADVTSGINGAIGDVQNGITGSATGQLPNSAPIQAPTKVEDNGNNDDDNNVKQPPKTKLEEGDDYTVSGLGNNWLLTGKDDITVSIGGVPYDVKVSNDAITSGAVYDALNAMYGGSLPDNGMVAVYGGSAYITTKGSWRRLVEEEVNQLINAYNHGLNNNYHTGGFVGDFNNLASNEEFAKLLKGEFVSTPAQMKKFMEETLPAIASYQSSGGSNEFNAPLVEIICESVTSESMPELKRVVDEAVKEIKKQLDSGMSRTGYKRSVKTI